MADAYLPCPDCEGDGRARPNEHGAYVGGDPENCSRCGGKGTSHDLTCPACSQRTPDHLMCECLSPVCVDCCRKEHNTTCSVCRGTTNVREWVYPTGFKPPKPCPNCGGTGRVA